MVPDVHEMIELGWGNPDASDFRDRYIRRLDHEGVTIYCHRVIRPMFRELIENLQQWGADLDKRQDDWGYANRDVRGYPGMKSYHAWGLAIDLDATENPMGQPGTTFPVFRTKVLAEHLGLTWGYIWGQQGYRSDSMHFEFRGSKRQCQYRAGKTRAERR